jgi:hypothetical protein
LHNKSSEKVVAPGTPREIEPVREIKRAELWPSDSADSISTDHTPQWFAGGVFAFSPDQKKLTYQNKSGRKLEIDLRAGEPRHLNWARRHTNRQAQTSHFLAREIGGISHGPNPTERR